MIIYKTLEFLLLKMLHIIFREINAQPNSIKIMYTAVLIILYGIFNDNRNIFL